MKSAVSLTIFLAVLVVAGVFHVANGHHKVREQQKAERVVHLTAKFERQCRALLPNHPESQLKCIKEALKK